jgi:hypothetical protein
MGIPLKIWIEISGKINGKSRAILKCSDGKEETRYLELQQMMWQFDGKRVCIKNENADDRVTFLEMDFEILKLFCDRMVNNEPIPNAEWEVQVYDCDHYKVHIQYAELDERGIVKNATIVSTF